MSYIIECVKKGYKIYSDIDYIPKEIGELCVLLNFCFSKTINKCLDYDIIFNVSDESNDEKIVNISSVIEDDCDFATLIELNSGIEDLIKDKSFTHAYYTQNDLFLDILSCIAHEHKHIIQLRKSKKKSAFTEISDLMKYLSNKSEIDAYAFEATHELILGCDPFVLSEYTSRFEKENKVRKRLMKKVYKNLLHFGYSTGVIMTPFSSSEV